MSAERDYGIIFQIGDILVSEEVITGFFCCDYPVCKGECCIAGEYGAPLDEDELQVLEDEYPNFGKYMTPAGHTAIAEKGFFELDIEGELVTTVAHGGECAYSFQDSAGNCLCAIEKCFFKGECAMRKPRSCWLYPVRVTKLTGGGLALNFHQWDVCRAAFEKGRKEGIHVYEFLREPLCKVFGDEFYEALCAAATKFRDSEI